MKFKNCFIDHHGNVWRTKNLIEKSKDLPVFKFSIEFMLDKEIGWNLTNVRDYCVHFERVKNADITIPIILRNDGCIMDGYHRVIKALTMGIKQLPARQFEVSPEPDFIITE